MSLSINTVLAEILAALGVVASLIYLAVQIRDNTKSNRISERKNTVGIQSRTPSISSSRERCTPYILNRSRNQVLTFIDDEGY